MNERHRSQIQETTPHPLHTRKAKNQQDEKILPPCQGREDPSARPHEAFPEKVLPPPLGGPPSELTGPSGKEA